MNFLEVIRNISESFNRMNNGLKLFNFERPYCCIAFVIRVIQSYHYFHHSDIHYYSH